MGWWGGGESGDARWAAATSDKRQVPLSVCRGLEGGEGEEQAWGNGLGCKCGIFGGVVGQALQAAGYANVAIWSKHGRAVVVVVVLL
jgi:hypothetical protein